MAQSVVKPGKRISGESGSSTSARKLALVTKLRDQIAAIEKRHGQAERAGDGQAAEGAAGFRTAPAGILHEVWTDQDRNAGAALGFALGQARALLDRQRPAILWVQLAHEGQETGLPYGPGLRRFGLDPEALVICRVQNVTEFLWAVEEAAGCQAVAAVIGDVVQPGKALDFTASRRFSMRAEAAGISIFMVRYGTGREASAAGLRWRVMPHLSGAAPFDARAPGVPRFEVALEKGEALMGLKQGSGNWILDWTDHGFERDTDGKLDGQPGEGRAAALSGAAFAALGYRLSETA